MSPGRWSFILTPNSDQSENMICILLPLVINRADKENRLSIFTFNLPSRLGPEEFHHLAIPEGVENRNIDLKLLE